MRACVVPGNLSRGPDGVSAKQGRRVAVMDTQVYPFVSTFVRPGMREGGKEVDF